VVELSNRLRLSFVPDLEVVLCEGRDEPAVSIRHGDEDTDGVAPAAKDRLLPPNRADPSTVLRVALSLSKGEHAKNTGGQCPACEEPLHSHDTFIPRPGS
jgi:hypothetical protein